MADFPLAGIIDELIQLRRDAVGFLDDFPGLVPNLRRRVFLFGNHLRQAADDVQRIPRFVRQSGGGQIHLFQMRVEFAGPDEADLKFRGFVQIKAGRSRYLPPRWVARMPMKARSQRSLLKVGTKDCVDITMIKLCTPFF